MLKFFLFFLISLLYSSNLVAQKLEFFKEEIVFEISEDYFFVDGIYYFRNLTQDTLRQLMFYPFPDENNFGEVDSVLAINLEDRTSKNQIINKKESGAFFIVSIEPGKIAKYRISYRQKIVSSQIKYILTTTRNWHKPLEYASFILKFPTTILVDSINFIPEHATIKDNKIEFSWSRENFMPEHDLDIFLNNKNK